MTRLLRVAFLMFAMLVVQPAAAQDFPKLSGRVVDAANVIDPAARATLDARLKSVEDNSTRQLVVVTIPDLQGYEISDYGFRLGRAWGIGQSETNNGILLIVAPNARKVRIEVGYGLEPIMTDALSHDIIENTILPKFRDGDLTAGIVAGTERIAGQLTLTPEEAARVAAEAEPARAAGDRPPIGMVVFWIAILLFFFIVPAIRAARGGGRRYRSGGFGNVATWIALNAISNAASGGSHHGGSGWGGSGGGFGGGGFSGGGGSFGGGGASGGW